MSTDLAVVGTVVPRMGLVDKVQENTLRRISNGLACCTDVCCAARMPMPVSSISISRRQRVCPGCMRC